MKKIIIITLKILITLLLIAPVLLLAIENLACRGPIKAPRQELVGAWDIEVNTHDGRLRFNFSIHEDGTIEGIVGDVAMQEAYLKRNRHWFSKLSTLRRNHRDYKIKGRLESSPTQKPRDAFWIQFNLDKEGAMTRIKAGLQD